jgi:hypothetical protein
VGAPARRLHGYLPVIAVGAFLAVGLVAGGAWFGLAGEALVRPLLPPAPTPLRAGAVAAPPEPEDPGPAPARAVPAVPTGPQGARAPSRRPGASLDRPDRRLLDLLHRKEDAAGVSAPPAGELSTGRATLDEAAVSGALARNSSAFSACIARAARTDAALRQRRTPLVMELVIEPSGRISGARLEDPKYAGSPLGQCLVATARRIVLPSFDGDQLLVQAPLKLTEVQ